MRLKMKSKSQRYDINRTRPRQRDKYTKCKMCLSIMIVIYIKQHLSNIWSSIHKKVKQHWGWVEKKRVQRFLLYQTTFLKTLLALIKRTFGINCLLILIDWLIFQSEELWLVRLNLI